MHDEGTLHAVDYRRQTLVRAHQQSAREVPGSRRDPARTCVAMGL
jgi:hypothetical protein